MPVSDEDLIARFAGHGVTRDNAAHYRGRLERRLLLERCSSCGRWHHPPRPVCPACWSPHVVPTEVSGRGTIALVTFLHQGPPADGVDYHTAYPVASVDLDEQPGLRFTSTILDATESDVSIGARVELDWIERAGVPLPVFRMAGGGSA